VTKIKTKKKLPKRVFRRPKRRRLDTATAFAAGGALSTVTMLLGAAGWIVATQAVRPVHPTLLAKTHVGRVLQPGDAVRAGVEKPAHIRTGLQNPIHRAGLENPIRAGLENPAYISPAVPRIRVFAVIEVPANEIAVIARRFDPRSEYMPLIRMIASRHDLPPSLVEAVMIVESDFNRLEVSNKGARGLMQVMPETAARFGVKAEELFDPEKNISAGAAYLNWLLDRYHGNVDLALAAYNAGEGAVDTYRGIPPYPETRTYVKRVLARLQEIAKRDDRVSS
jgi:soluble lytic murein transglycosylase-like protein